MVRPQAASPLLAAGLLLGLLVLPGCEGRKHQAQAGPLKDWIVGSWVRMDDKSVWNFNASNEMATNGRVPIEGSYSTEEPNKVQVRISGAGAVSAGMQLALPVDQNKNLVINFIVKDDEMRPDGINSTVVFVKK